MREIKFRAWDKEKKEMFNDIWIDGNFINMPEYIVMQFTGLKDKNGKEIYEGDIIESRLNNYIWRYEIKSLEGFGNSLYKVTRYRNFRIDEFNEYVMKDCFVNEGRSELIGIETSEIIGNVYENPELLKKVGGVK